MRKNMIHPDKPQMHIACWIPKATDAHSEYTILIVFIANNHFAKAPERYIILTLPVL